MANLLNQKKLAAKVLDCGLGRVWMNPEASEQISGAITREDIRDLINEGVIKEKRVKGVSRGRARVLDAKRKYGHRKGHGSRKGAKGARTNSKEQWMKKIRAQRKYLKECRADGTIDKTVYCKFYRKAKGGEFRNVAHLKAQIDALNKE
ncbi:MAG: 50S ribosomal protein L19e [Methanosarcinaceae archaeon]|nr:50S ribosomal protein L19e [Methanosarcinaceae archaeon]